MLTLDEDHPPSPQIPSFLLLSATSLSRSANNNGEPIRWLAPTFSVCFLMGGEGRIAAQKNIKREPTAGGSKLKILSFAVALVLL